MTSETRDRAAWVERHVREHCFTPTGASPTFGAELELLAFDAVTKRIAPIFPDGDARGSLTVVRDVGRRLGWQETTSDKGVPKFLAPDGSSLTFEPGGQLEYASSVHDAIDSLLLELCAVETSLGESAGAIGIDLLAGGIDPFNDAGDAALQLTAGRYSRMAEYFATIGPAGARMMRQTASLQINVGGIPVGDRWNVANALAPWLVALFANSPKYGGRDTGFASYRAETWRHVDPRRTGVLPSDDPVREYAAFALAAPAFLADTSAPAFRDLDAALVTPDVLATHLTTLFPEVRPRGYLELRSTDAIPHERRGAALALVAGILADADASCDALSLLGPADAETLEVAGRHGVSAPRIAAKIGPLVDIALDGCRRLGNDVVSERLRAELGNIR